MSYSSFPGPRLHPQSHSSVFSLLEDQVIPEHLEVLEQHVISVRNHFLPVCPAGGGYRGADKLAVRSSVFVGQDVEEVATDAKCVLFPRLLGDEGLNSP